MDKIEALGNSIAQISMYDLKSYYNQAKAVVLNYTEMEAKVRDATNDDPWGASSTLMQEIAQGTFNFQQFNEIMPTIYKRFTEKEAREWRQIYKALQLLEYLIKHGSERVIDDARSHISMIKILRNFHYVDDKGKDQGINVRNRAKEIAELLSDLDRVRQERRKAKSSRNKYVGVGNEGPSFTSASGSKYGGFGNDSSTYGNNDDWNNGAGSSSRDRYTGGSSSFKQNDDFEEYDAGEWEDRPSGSTNKRTSVSTTARGSVSSARKNSITVNMKKATEKAAPTPKQPEVDLFSIADDDVPVAVPSQAQSKVAAPAVSLDDDFDDFQSAPPATTSANSVPQSASSKPNVFDLLNSAPSAAPVQTNAQPQLMGNMNSTIGSQPSMFSSAPMQPMTMGGGMMNNNTFNKPLNPSGSQPGQSNGAPSNATKPADDFGDLFSFAGMTKSNSSNAPASSKSNQPKISMAAMAREQSSASIWGGNNGAKPAASAAAVGGSIPSSSVPSGGNNDDLLL